MLIAEHSRAIKQAIARIHWSIAYAGLDSVLELEAYAMQPAEFSAALCLVDEALAELREAYSLASVEPAAVAIPALS